MIPICHTIYCVFALWCGDAQPDYVPECVDELVSEMKSNDPNPLHDPVYKVTTDIAANHCTEGQWFGFHEGHPDAPAQCWGGEKLRSLDTEP